MSSKVWVDDELPAGEEDGGDVEDDEQEGEEGAELPAGEALLGFRVVEVQLLLEVPEILREGPHGFFNDLPVEVAEAAGEVQVRGSGWSMKLVQRTSHTIVNGGPLRLLLLRPLPCVLRVLIHDEVKRVERRRLHGLVHLIWLLLESFIHLSF